MPPARVCTCTSQVLDFDIAAFFTGLGYTAQRMGIEVLQQPPVRKRGIEAARGVRRLFSRMGDS